MDQSINRSLAIIPARSGSKSIKNKNVKLFNGKPLIAWTIELALASNLSRVIVTTDSEEIKKIAIDYGAEVPYLRDNELSSDTIGIEPVITDVIDYLSEIEEYVPDCITLLLPTSPFRSVDDINRSIELYEKKDVTSVVSVSLATANHNPYWMLRKDNDVVTMFDGSTLSKMISRRQDLPSFFIKNDFVFTINPNNLFLNESSLYGDRVELMPISEDRLDVDINTDKDWKIAELLFEFL